MRMESAATATAPFQSCQWLAVEQLTILGVAEAALWAEAGTSGPSVQSPSARDGATQRPPGGG